MRAVPITMDGSQFHCVSQKSSPMSAIDGDLSYRSLAYFLLSYVAYNRKSSIKKISRHSFSILSTSPEGRTPGSPSTPQRSAQPSHCNRPPTSTSILSLPVPPRPSFQDATTAKPPRHSHDQTRIQPAS